MKFLFLGCLFNENEEKCLMNKSKIGLQGAVNTYQWNLIKGLDKNLDRPVDIINVLPVGTFPKYFKDLLLRTRGWKHISGAEDLEIGSINIPFLKQIIRAISCKKAIYRWLRSDNNDKSIIIYSTYWPFLHAVKNIPSNVIINLIVTDLPEYYDLSSSSNLIKKILRKIYNHFIYTSLKRINSFVILTKQMKMPLNIGERPYVVIEGLVNFENNSYCNEMSQVYKKAVLYTGTLNYKYGIDNLLKAFKLINRVHYELWICGSGEAKDEIIKISELDKRIKYFGYVSKKEVYELQQKTTVLINPRKNEGEYTKYSFPSKTMEYMLSGKPVLMYKLDGIPNEYDQYLYYIKGDTPEDMADCIVSICEKPQAELDEFGERAKKFVLENKNSMVQAKKIVDMIEVLERKKPIILLDVPKSW